MDQQRHDFIVEAARKAHRRYWKKSGDESTGDKLAKRVTEAWQESVKEYNAALRTEYPIDPKSVLKERIDVVDTESGVAYEMKVSHNNPHMEFYRDIFKVILARDNGLSQLKRFVFLTPKEGADKLLKNMGGVIKEKGGEFVRLEINIEPILAAEEKK